MTYRYIHIICSPAYLEKCAALHALQFASLEQKSSKRVLLAGLTQDKHALTYANFPESECPQLLAVAAVWDDYASFEHCTEEVRCDEDLVLAAVQINSRLCGIYWKPILSFWDPYLRRNFVGRTPNFVETSSKLRRKDP